MKVSFPLDTIICGDNVAVLRTFPDACIDLTVTSPPYDNLRKYKGFTWDFEGVAQELWRVTKAGGIVVWVVGDATVKGSETGTSFRQALRFMEIGFRLHDTMIYGKLNGLPQFHNAKRYNHDFEYMFILTKGVPITFNAKMVPKASPPKGGTARISRKSSGREEIRRSISRSLSPVKLASNIWNYYTGNGHAAKEEYAYTHPALYPEQLAEDHILSWSNPGDVVLDPFNGSGTTCKMALLNDRHYIGIDVAEEYCEIARKRIEKAQASRAEQARLF